MYCEICHQEIVERHTIHTLFKREMHHICDYCFRRYPLHIKQTVLPINEGVIYWTSMIKSNDYISSMAYMSFMKPFYLDYINHYKKCLFLHFDKLSSTILTILDSMKLGDVYLLTLHENIDEEEENEYDI